MSELKNFFGIMHGRLSLPLNGQIQAFPVDTWRDEFTKARLAGLVCIEWIYEVDNEECNPLSTDEGIVEMQALSIETGVFVKSVCADYYMQNRLIDKDGLLCTDAITHLEFLLEQAHRAEIQYIILPFVDSSSLKSERELSALYQLLDGLKPCLEKKGIELHLETDFPPEKLAEIFAKVNHPLILANYDMGNSASLGYDPIQELNLLRPWLGSVHVKDRLLQGTTVPLGEGDTDLSTCFHLLSEINYQRPYILQVAREIDGDEVNLAIRNRLYVERLIAQNSL